jgi:DHA2 family multidrug resistance protein-like MFS transporter
MSVTQIAGKTPARAWWVLSILSLGFLIITVEHLVLNVALRTLQDSLSATTGQLQWIVSGYHLSLASLLLTAGSLADRMGRKRVLLTGHAVLALASTLAAFSSSPVALIGLRLLMGAGAAMILPASLAIIRNTFDGRSQQAALAIWATVGGLGLPIGLLTGGALLSHFWWGSIFMVIPVFGALAFIGIAVAVKDPRANLNDASKSRPRVDFLGQILSILALGSVVWALIEGSDYGWGSRRIIAAFTAFAVLGTAWVIWERTTNHPMVQLSWLRKRGFSAAAVALDLAYFGVLGLLFLLALYLQVVQGFSAWEAGIRMLPAAGGSILGGVVALRLSKRSESPGFVIFSGVALIAVALGMLRYTRVDGGYPLLATALAVAGLGLAMAATSAQHSILSTLDGERAGVGSALADTARYVGGVLGVALIPSVLQSIYHSKVAGTAALLPPEAGERVRSGVAGADAVADALKNDAVRHVAFNAFVEGLHVATLVGMAVVAVASVVPLVFLRRRKVPARVDPPTMPIQLPTAQRDPVYQTPLVRERELMLGDQWVRLYEVDGRGPTALLLPGWRRNGQYWRHVLQYFAERGQRAVAVDLPGLGQAAERGSLFDQCVRTVGMVLDAVERDNDRFVLVGHSMGAAVVGVYAATRDDPRVIGWTFIAPPGLEESEVVEGELRGARKLLTGPERFTSGKLEALAAEWSAEPDSDPLDVAGVREQLRVVTEFMRELPDRFVPERVTGRSLWVFLSEDRRWSLNGIRSLEWRSNQQVVAVQCRHAWRPEDTEKIGIALLRFVWECAQTEGGSLDHLLPVVPADKEEGDSQ